MPDRPTLTPPASRDLNTPAVPQAVPSSAIPAKVAGEGVPVTHQLVLTGYSGLSNRYRCGALVADSTRGTLTPRLVTCAGCLAPADATVEAAA